MRRAPCGYTVPMYADGCELLVFRTFSQSAGVSKRVFRHAEAAAAELQPPPQYIIPKPPSATEEVYGYGLSVCRSEGVARRGNLI